MGQTPCSMQTARLVPCRLLRGCGRPRGTASAGPVAAGADEARLARRLRLAHDWPQLREESGGDIVSAYTALVNAGHLEVNPAQASAASSLAKLPAALATAREAQKRWSDQQMHLTREAQAAADRTQMQREEASTASKGGWLKRTPPEAPMAPAVIGPVCWLGVGPPPVLKPAGCYVHGSVGSGKSTLMDLFCLFGSDWRVRRQHGHEFALWLHQSMHDLGGSSGKERGKESRRNHVLGRVADLAAEGTDILCLDEFAITNVADAAIFTELLRLLAQRQLAVVCTTNRPPEDLYKDGLHRDRYLPELISHLRESYITIPIQGDDYRQAAVDREEQQDVVVSPVFFQGGDIDEALRSVLSSDAAGDLPSLSPGFLKVAWGRSMPVPASGAGVALFAFNDVCRSAFSAEDFMYLAQQYHTVCVHSIPRLRLEEHNEARRFTNLVDALYEHSVRLVCHSLVPIADVLESVQALREASEDGGLDAAKLGVFDKMYDDTPNFQLQIKEMGREKYEELQIKRLKEEDLRYEALQLKQQKAPEAVEGDVGSGWSAAPASADLSAPDAGVAGVMVAAVGCLQESGFAASRALSRLKEMQTAAYLDTARERREAMTISS